MGHTIVLARYMLNVINLEIVNTLVVQVGYTGDPYSGCVDLDECAYPEENTCAGGMNPSGIDTDAFFDTYTEKVFYLGDTEADGYSQVSVRRLLIKRIISCQTGQQCIESYDKKKY